jgi:glycosyltransferase involved in cell wall biosynthesis
MSASSTTASRTIAEYPPASVAQLRLGFVTCRGACALDGRWASTAGVSRLLDCLQRWFGQVKVAMSRWPEGYEFFKDPLHVVPDDFVPMPWLPSVVGGFHKIGAVRRAVREVEEQSDVLVVQLPFITPLSLLGARRPRVYLLTADLPAAARLSPAYGGWRRPAALLFGKALDATHHRLVRAAGARVVSNGRQLWEQHGCPPGRVVVSATLFEREIQSVARRRPGGSPFRLLFVGFLRYEKGIDVLLQAFDRLVEAIPSAQLQIVGGCDALFHNVSENIRREVELRQRKSTVELLGDIPFGPQLFQCFADADVLALPSRSEGTPRVLVEARAFGCPVVATSVGGIPESVEHEVDGLLVPVDDPAALAEAVLRIARDSALRERLVTGGLERARRTTVETYAQAIAEEAWEAWHSATRAS